MVGGSKSRAEIPEALEMTTRDRSFDERLPRRKSAVSPRAGPPLLSCGCKAGRRPAPQCHARACGDGTCQLVNTAEKSRYGVRHGGPSAWR